MKRYLVTLMFLFYLIFPDNARAAPSKYIEFDGVDDYIRIPHSENINFGLNDEFTVELWVKPHPVQIEDFFAQILVKLKDVFDKPRAYDIKYRVSSGVINADRHNGEWSKRVSSSVNINDGNWHHIAYVKREGVLELYVDGVFDRSQTDSIDGDTKNIGDLFIGGHYKGEFVEIYSNMFRGSVSDVRIWNYPRSQSDVFDNKNVELSGNETGLVGYWKLDGIKNGVIKDYTSNANHGVLYNSDLEDSGDETDEPISVDLDSTVGIASGVLSIIKPSLMAEFGDIILNGNIQESSASIDAITVTDARGTGEGWHLTVSATEFTELGGKGYKLPSGSLTLKFLENVTALTGTNPILPTIATDSAVIDDGAAHTILTAAEGEGLGSFEASFPDNALTLSINPANTFVDRQTYDNTPTLYETTITWSIISGP